MNIILIQDVENLGLTGQVLDVAPGYARNFLLPKRYALLANDGNLKMLAKKRAEYEARAKAEKDQAALLKDKIDDFRLVFNRKAGERGKLYGAVTAIDIAEALIAAGFNIERRRLRLSEPIKSLGEYEVPLRLHADFMAFVKVAVHPEKDEADVAAEGDKPKED